MAIVRKVGKNDCAGCERGNYCYFGVAFKTFPTLKRVVFEDQGFASCWKAEKVKASSAAERTLEGEMASPAEMPLM